MKIFIDTNIFLDLILKRDGYEEAMMILNSCSKEIFEGFVADITLLNIDYVASKQTKDIKDFLKAINRSFHVIGGDNGMFESALKIDNDDLEDTLQYICAKQNICEVIITNDKGFYRTNDMRVMGSKEFIANHIGHLQ
ncbi:MAG: PIN domain-containing protein [Campylobacterota bacterium]|nr:PIN domain-containing protein [Campylobacterota bacterium]